MTDPADLPPDEFDDSEPDDPFAEFAVPKKSAVEEYRERLEQDRRRSRQGWLFLASVSAGAVLGGAAGVSVGVSWTAFPLAVALGGAGALAGLLVGWVVGAGAYASRSFQTLSGTRLMAPDAAPGHAWDKAVAWMQLWGVFGIVCGAAAGTTEGALLMRPAATADLAAPWAIGGAAVGLGVAAALWFLSLRRGSRSSS